MNDIGVIHLTNGGFAVVDADRVEELSVRRWYNSNGYACSAVRTGKKTVTFGMHRVIFGAKKGQAVDHANRVKMDNRQSNLRLASKSQNAGNAKKRTAGIAASQYKGVQWDKGAWCARIKSGDQKRYLGRFQSEVDAARDYNSAALQLFGEYANINAVP